MKRLVLASILATAFAAQAAVDLGESGVLDRIQSEDPQRYARIMDIMRIASDVSCETLPGILKVQHDVKAARCNGALILTSYPAKRHLFFVLEDTSYVVNVVLSGKPAKAMRAADNCARPATRP